MAAIPLTKLPTTQDVLEKFTKDTPGIEHPYIPNEAVNGDNAPGLQRTLIILSLKCVPTVGSVLSSVAATIWPDPRDSDEFMWKKIEASVVNVAVDETQRNNADELSSQLEGLRSGLTGFFGLGTRSSFDSMLSRLDQASATFRNDKSPWYSLPYLIPMATLHLAALWTRCTRDFHEKFGKDETEDERNFYVTQLHDYIDKYTAAVDKAKKECMKWRRGMITTQKVDGEGPLGVKLPHAVARTRKITVADQVNGWAKDFTWEVDNVPHAVLVQSQADMEYESAKFWVGCIYHERLRDLTDPSRYWGFYRQGSSKPTSIDRWCLEQPGWLGDGCTPKSTMFDDWDCFENNGPITKVVLHADTVNGRLGGIEVFYGGQSSGLRGAANPNAMAVMDLGGGESFTKMHWWHESGKPLMHLAFVRSSMGGDGQLTVGPPAPVWGPWNYSHDARPPGRAEPWRLLCLCGWSTDGPGYGSVDRLWPIFGYMDRTHGDNGRTEHL